MAGSSCVAPVITGVLIFFPPESPRWLIANGHTLQSLESLIQLRSTEISGAKDFYILYESLKFESELNVKLTIWEQFISLFTVLRNRFAVVVSLIGILSPTVWWCQYFGFVYSHNSKKCRDRSSDSYCKLHRDRRWLFSSNVYIIAAD